MQILDKHLGELLSQYQLDPQGMLRQAHGYFCQWRNAPGRLIQSSVVSDQLSEDTAFEPERLLPLLLFSSGGYPLPGVQLLLAQADRLGRHLDKFIFGDKFDRLVQR